MNRWLRLCCILALVLPVATGCKSVAEKKKDDALDNTLDAYEAAIRWGFFDSAYSMLQPREGSPGSPPDSLRNIKVIAYEVVQPPVFLDPGSAVQMVEIQYVHQDTQVVRTLRDRQLWHYDDDSKRWLLDGDLPAFQ